MTQRAKLQAPRKNVLTAAPAQLAYSGFLSRPEGGRDERRVRRDDFPGADCRFAWKAAFRQEIRVGDVGGERRDRSGCV